MGCSRLEYSILRFIFTPNPSLPGIPLSLPFADILFHDLLPGF